MFNQPQINRQQNPWSFGMQPGTQPILPQPQFGGVPQLEAPGGTGATSQMSQAPQPQGQMNPMLLLSQLLQGGGAQQHPFDFAGALGAIRNDPQGDANKGYLPGVNNQYSPFSNGFFAGASGKPQGAPRPGDPNFVGPVQPGVQQQKPPGNFGASANPWGSF